MNRSTAFVMPFSSYCNSAVRRQAPAEREVFDKIMAARDEGMCRKPFVSEFQLILLGQ
jgi:hypothetical protein